ncbi:MAG: protein kinase [Pyrinomonadaceae bacterium]
MRSLAEALAYAHADGIVHRDIKPENIMLRPDGYMKILDFGLAKLTEQDEQPPNLTKIDKTEMSSGLVMGTLKYMSPEQAQGKQVDRRSDIFSFGVVLYEMLAGRAPFEGKTSNDLIAAILKSEPPPLSDVPEEIRRLIAKAMHKKKEERYQKIEELLGDLKSLKEEKTVTAVSGQIATSLVRGSSLSTSETTSSTSSTLEYVISGIKRHKTRSVVVVASLVMVSVGLTVEMNRVRSKLHTSSGEIKITRIPNTDRAGTVAISPDGEYIAYAETSDITKPNVKSLWVLEIATNKRVEIVSPAHVFYFGLTYSRDGTELFYLNEDTLYRISANGGEPTKVLGDVAGAISFAPDGTQFAFVRQMKSEEMALVIGNVYGGGERVLATRKRPEFFGRDGPAWSPDGSLIACATGVIAKSHAGVVGFDVNTGDEKKITDPEWDEITGRLVWLPDGSGLVMSATQGTENHIWQLQYPRGEAHRVTSDPNYGYFDLSLAADGEKLATIESATRSSIWLLPKGDSSAAAPITSGEHNLYRAVSWTPDGRVLYASNIGVQRDIWIVNGDGTEPKQLTANAGVNLQPHASADGRYVVFSSNRANKGAFNIWRVNIDGSNPVQLTNGIGEGQPVCSPDGRWVVYSKGGPNTTPSEKTLWKVAIDGGEAVQLCDKPSSGAAISTDGTLIACWYQQDPTSPRQIALIPFGGGPPIRLFDANNPAINPVHWSPDGQTVDHIITRAAISNIWRQPVSGGPPQQLTQFTSERIDGFDWSRDARLVCSRLHSAQDILLITDFR